MGMSLVAPAQLRLTNDQHTESILIRALSASGRDPVLCSTWDPGAPEPREYQSPVIGGDGVTDSTEYTGARTVTLDLVVFGDAAGSPYAYVERLAALAAPSQRAWLYAMRADPALFGEEWRMALRGDPLSITYNRAAASRLELRLIFTAPGGYFESPERPADLHALAVGGAELVFPCAFTPPPAPGGIIFGAGAGAGSPAVSATIGGTVPTSPTVYLYGPFTDGSASIRTSRGHLFAVSGVSLDPGEYVEINMAAGTIRELGDPARSLYHLVDWRVSTFWRLDPGPIEFRAVGATEARVRWRDKRITI